MIIELNYRNFVMKMITLILHSFIIMLKYRVICSSATIERNNEQNNHYWDPHKINEKCPIIVFARLG